MKYSFSLSFSFLFHLRRIKQTLPKYPDFSCFWSFVRLLNLLSVAILLQVIRTKITPIKEKLSAESLVCFVSIWVYSDSFPFKNWPRNHGYRRTQVDRSSTASKILWNWQCKSIQTALLLSTIFLLCGYHTVLSCS